MTVPHLADQLTEEGQDIARSAMPERGTVSAKGNLWLDWLTAVAARILGVAITP